MSTFNNEFNFNDSKIRNIIISVLGEMQNKIKIKQYTNSNEFTNITIPFYYSLTGAADFLIDSFMTSDYTKYHNDREVDGNYEQVPRGILTMSSLSIDSGSLVNRHVRTTIPKKVDETTFKMYSYETIILPLIISFDVKIISNSNLEMFKITESIFSSLYKTNPIYIDFGGYRVRGHVTIPEDVSNEKVFEFGQGDKEQNELNFTIDVTTSMPVFDEKSEIFMGNKMTTITGSIYELDIAPTNDLMSNQDGSYITQEKKDENKLGEYKI